MVCHAGSGNSKDVFVDHRSRLAVDAHGRSTRHGLEIEDIWSGAEKTGT